MASLGSVPPKVIARQRGGDLAGDAADLARRLHVRVEGLELCRSTLEVHARRRPDRGGTSHPRRPRASIRLARVSPPKAAVPTLRKSAAVSVGDRQHGRAGSVYGSVALHLSAFSAIRGEPQYTGNCRDEGNAGADATGFRLTTGTAGTRIRSVPRTSTTPAALLGGLVDQLRSTGSWCERALLAWIRFLPAARSS